MCCVCVRICVLNRIQCVSIYEWSGYRGDVCRSLVGGCESSGILLLLDKAMPEPGVSSVLTTFGRRERFVATLVLSQSKLWAFLLHL